MKKTLIAMTILFASVANAGEITFDQMRELYEVHKDAYETVTPGMSFEYNVLRKETDENGEAETCVTYVKEVVVSVNPGFKYLVYQKEVAQTDCKYWPAKKGDTEEYLTWRSVGRSDDWRGSENFHYSKITTVGNIITTQGYTLGAEGEKRSFKNTRDASISQFYNLVETNSRNNYIRRLIKRGESDVNAIKIENLEVYDESEDEE